MKSYVEEIETHFNFMEKEHWTEEEIIDHCVDGILSHQFDCDFIYDLNDTLYNRGYSYQFEVPSQECEKFDNKKYYALVTNVTKSEKKTNDLIAYLNSVKDHRICLASLHLLKIRYLISLNYLPNNEFFNAHCNDSIRDVFFANYLNDEIRTTIVSFLENIGFEYASLAYNEFRIDMEYLLWSIEEKDPNKGYLKVNTIKVARQIAPKEYFINQDKVYYNPQLSLVEKDYLKLIDKEKIHAIKEKYNYEPYPSLNDGYCVLFKSLKD